MEFALYETQGYLSDEAVADLSLALDTFYSGKLDDIYNNDGDYFKAISLIPVGQRQSSITLPKSEERIQNLRGMKHLSGTEIIYSGTIEFLGSAPSSSEIIGMIAYVTNKFNVDIISGIIGAGNAELGDVFMVRFENDPKLQSPSLPPSIWSENHYRTPDGIQGPGEKELKGPDTAVIIMTIAGIATLTMLLFVFATRTRRNRDDAMVPTTPACRNYGYASINDDLNENAEQSIVSFVTGFNEYADRISHQVQETGSNLEEDYEVEAGRWRRNANSGMLQSAAAINCKGTMTWLSALHGDSMSIIASPKQRDDHDLEESSADDTSTENLSDTNRGGFPGYNEGSFPTGNVDSNSGRKGCRHIRTVDEDDLSESKLSALDIGQALSQETDESKSSLKQFISDLVWLKNNSSDENAKEHSNTREGNQGGAGIEVSDSNFYECDVFSPRTLSDEECSTVASIANSQAMSIVCIDCYIPPGKLDIEICSTKDGPVITNIGDKSLGGYLGVGDLIMALDDRDTRSLSAEELTNIISSRSSFQRKLTLLHSGRIRK